MNFRFHPEALAEFNGAAHYYAGIQPALGLRFTATIEAAVKTLVETPQMYAILEQDVRRCLTHAFPYGVLYTIETDYILIVAVMHGHQKPGYWRHRMVSEP